MKGIPIGISEWRHVPGLPGFPKEDFIDLLYRNHRAPVVAAALLSASLSGRLA